jgi:hypothetical protein
MLASSANLIPGKRKGLTAAAQIGHIEDMSGIRKSMPGYRHNPSDFIAA